MEKVKRLAPTTDVLRELYLKSGNICAFPNCHEVMINEDGTFLGNICHIEAANEGGERFNPDMNNEDRRAFSNLMLMCPQHHKITNDVILYPVSKLTEMKAKHEMKFSGILNRIKNSLVDYGFIEDAVPAKNCQKLNRVLRWDCDEDQMEENCDIINELQDLIKDIPPETKKLLSILVMRMGKNSHGNNQVSLPEVEYATGINQYTFKNHIDILQRTDISSEPYEDDNGIWVIQLNTDLCTGWDYWHDIRNFIKRTRIDASRIFVDLDFSVFDE